MLTDDLDTREKVLPQGIQLLNMKAISLTIQKLWPILKFLADKEMDRQKNKSTGQKLYVPDLSMQGNKKNLILPI